MMDPSLDPKWPPSLGHKWAPSAPLNTSFNAKMIRFQIVGKQQSQQKHGKNKTAKKRVCSVFIGPTLWQLEPTLGWAFVYLLYIWKDAEDLLSLGPPGLMHVGFGPIRLGSHPFPHIKICGKNVAKIRVVFRCEEMVIFKRAKNLSSNVPLLRGKKCGFSTAPFVLKMEVMLSAPKPTNEANTTQKHKNNRIFSRALDLCKVYRIYYTYCI